MGDERTHGVLPDEVVRPADRVVRHIASGSGWERARGGGRVPERNPWREDRRNANPAQEGIGLFPYLGPERRRLPGRGAPFVTRR